MNKEIWKPIKGYEELYEVSNLGNVRSLTTIINCKGAKGIDTHIRNGKVLSKAIGTTGYYIVVLSRNSKTKQVRIHRLVAEAFLDNPNNYPCVNHIDGNKLNNNVDNLEWCTHSHNNKEAYRLGLKKSTWGGVINKDNPNSKPLLQFDLNGNFIREWESAAQVKRELGYCAENIRNCCKGRRPKANGYLWEYKKE